MASTLQAAMETLHQVKSTEPPIWLAPKQELSEAVRLASKHLFSCLKPHTPKSPFDQLLVEGFDAEQIWQQIDLQSQPLISSLRREVRKFDKNPKEILKLKEALEGAKKGALEEKKRSRRTNQVDDDEEEDEDDDDMALDSDEEDEEEEEEDGDSESEGEGEEKGGIEDRFLKIKELQEYLEEDEAKEFGLKKKNKSLVNKNDGEDEESDDEFDDGEDGEDEEEEEEEDELGVFDRDEDDDDEDEDTDKFQSARYEDFYGNEKKKNLKRKVRDESEEISGSEDEQDDGNASGNQKKDGLSKHEKEVEKLQSKIELMEKANLDPKVWTMRGEVTAAQRQKNSALEVDLDFEHNVRPAPVITEEVTVSLEDMIKNRIVEAKFDDVQKAPALPTKAPREIKEMDETKSKKSLADIYEEDYMKKTNPASAPLSFSDERKKEASMLFKKLCLKLDALSHFHFTPKPVIEDMAIQPNIPALAMEEIAPMAVSDAAMLAPEEVFSGKGYIKDETELTKEERKRRRANKKRKFKAGAVERMPKKTEDDNKLTS